MGFTAYLVYCMEYLLYSLFMRIVSFLLNLPWTLLGILKALLSWPVHLQFSRRPLAMIFHVKSFWWYTWIPGYKKVRAQVTGHVILLGPTADDKDLAHELIHVEQFERAPLIQPVLYLYQMFRHGYRQNKYEVEAYDKSDSRYDET